MNLPKEVIVEITDKCNLDCSFCYNNRRKNSNVLNNKEIKQLLSKISAWGVKAVRFTGGEPPLRNDFEKILISAKQNSLFIILNTNGTLIHKNLHLMKHVDLLLLTMHTTSQAKEIPKTLDMLRGKNFMLATIALKENIYQLQRFYDLAKWVKNNHSNFCEWFLLRPIYAGEKKELTKKDLRILRDNIIINNKKYKMNTKIANTVPLCTVKGISKVCKGGHFDGGHERIFINVEGEVYADYFKSLKLENIHNHSLKEIWESPILKKQRNYKNLPRHCKECYLLEKCKGGLKGDNRLINPHNICPLISVIIPIKKGEIDGLLKALDEQKCRKSAFEVIIPIELKTHIETKKYRDLRIVYANNPHEAQQKARGKIRLNLRSNHIPKDYLAQLIKKTRF